MTAYARSSRYTARHVLRLWCAGYAIEISQQRTWRSRNRRTNR